MDNPDAIDLAETEVSRLIMVCHKQGLNYWQILRIFLNSCVQLLMMADAEWWLKREG